MQTDKTTEKSDLGYQMTWSHLIPQKNHPHPLKEYGKDLFY